MLVDRLWPRGMSKSRAETLLEASKDPLISEVAVLAELLHELPNPEALPRILDRKIVCVAFPDWPARDPLIIAVDSGLGA